MKMSKRYQLDAKKKATFYVINNRNMLHHTHCFERGYVDGWENARKEVTDLLELVRNKLVEGGKKVESSIVQLIDSMMIHVSQIGNDEPNKKEFQSE